jgi:trigger factor
MRYEISRLPHASIELRVTIAREDMQREVTRALEELRKDLELPGFRKGTVPADLARETIGEFALYAHAVRHAASHALANIFEKESLEPIARPEITVTKLVPGNDAEFTARFPVLPTVTLPKNWRELIRETGKERREPEVKDEEVRAALAWLRESRSTQTPISRPAQKGDAVTATIRASSEGKPIPNASLEHHSFILGSAAFMPGVEDAIEGLSRGDVKDFVVRAPDDYWVEALRGKSVEFHVEIEEVRARTIPPLDDEFARSIGRFKNLGELDASIRQGMLAEKREKEKERMRILMLERLSAVLDFEVPDALLSRELDQMLMELKTLAEQLGMTWEQYLESLQRTEEALRETLKDEALRRVRFALILRQIAAETHAEPTKEELESEMQRYLLRYASPAEAERHIDIAELARYTRSALKNEKAFQYLETIAAGRNDS